MWPIDQLYIELGKIYENQARDGIEWNGWWVMTAVKMLLVRMLAYNFDLFDLFSPYIKVIYPKHSKHWPYIVAYTIDCLCSKMLNHGSNHGLFLSLFKLIPSIDCISISLFKFHYWILCPVHYIFCFLYFGQNDEKRKKSAVLTLLENDSWFS